jgi:hypothetical protein
VTFTVNPVAVATGAENCGVNAAPRTVVPVTVADPETWPVLVVATLTVEDAGASIPVMVNGRMAPLAVPIVTVPVLPFAIEAANVYAGL